MVEVKMGLRTVDLPYTVRVQGVSEEMFLEMVDEDTRAELLDGEMIMPSPASPRHNRIAGFLRTLTSLYAEEDSLGEIFGPDDLIHLATCRCFAPDAFFLLQARVPQPLPEDQFEGPPDLIVEVLSPSTRTYDLDEKLPAYQEAGVPEIWYVDPDQEQVTIHRRRRRTYATDTVANGRVTSSVVSGFWLQAQWLWGDPLPRVKACLRKILK
jgi:Uma2 family endonuclease